jgi:tetratricopeptide (TPR) repeat protein
MAEDERASTLTTVVNLCDEAFPDSVEFEKERSLCRLYEGQLVEPLLRIMVCTDKTAAIKARVGFFLWQDGKYNDSEKLLLQATEMYRSVLGTEHLETLKAMYSLALTYQAQGRNVDAVRIQEEVLEKEKKILGEEYPYTLMAVHALAVIYQKQGRNVEAVKIQEEVLEREEDIGRRAPRDTCSDVHPRLDVSSAGKKCRCSQDSGGGVGEGEQDIGIRAPGHAYYIVPSCTPSFGTEGGNHGGGSSIACWRVRTLIG